MMQAKLSVFVAVLVFVVGVSAKCEEVPADFSMMNCCKSPNMASNELGKVVESVNAQKLEGFLRECKTAEAIMKELKLAKGDVFDQDAVVSYLEMKATEPLWKEPFKAIGELCSKEIAAKKDEILKEFEKAPFNVKKEQCNAVYNYMMHCVTFEAFKKCPKASWTEDKRCASSKAWMEKCDNMSIIKELFAKFGI